MHGFAGHPSETTGSTQSGFNRLRSKGAACGADLRMHGFAAHPSETTGSTQSGFNRLRSKGAAYGADLRMHGVAGIRLKRPVDPNLASTDSALKSAGGEPPPTR